MRMYRLNSHKSIIYCNTEAYTCDAVGVVLACIDGNEAQKWAHHFKSRSNLGVPVASEWLELDLQNPTLQI